MTTLNPSPTPMNPTPVVAKPVVNRPAAPKKSPAKWFVLGGFALLMVVIVGAVIAKRNRQAVVTVTTDKAITKTITQVVSATGKVQPEIEVKIAPEVSGEIIELPFREGAAV